MITFFWYLVVMIASYFISQALAPKPADAQRASFDDFDFPQFDEGTPQAVFFGDNWTKDWMVLGVGNYRTEDIESDGGGK